MAYSSLKSALLLGSLPSIWGGDERLLSMINERSAVIGESYGQCRILSVAFKEKEKAFEGYGYKPEPEMDYVVDSERVDHAGCDFEVYSHEAIDRSFLLGAKRPLIIRGATDTWAAHEKWSLDQLLATHNDTVFHAGPTWQHTLGDALARHGQYHTGQMGMESDCYTDSGGRWMNRDKGPPGTLKTYERQYSPFLGTSAAADYTVPEYLLPARLLYMGVGVGHAGGVIPEEHPSSWFATIKGRKRWVVHPPNLQSPRMPDGVGDLFLRNRECTITSFFESTLTCDQQEGDIIWLPGGWWHETCNVGDFAVGIGGVTYDEQLMAQRRARGECSLSDDAQLNAFLRTRTGGEYSISQVPYCASDAHQCPSLPDVVLPAKVGKSAALENVTETINAATAAEAAAVASAPQVGMVVEAGAPSCVA